MDNLFPTGKYCPLQNVKRRFAFSDIRQNLYNLNTLMNLLKNMTMNKKLKINVSKIT